MAHGSVDLARPILQNSDITWVPTLNPEPPASLVQFAPEVMLGVEQKQSGANRLSHIFSQIPTGSNEIAVVLDSKPIYNRPVISWRLPTGAIFVANAQTLSGPLAELMGLARAGNGFVAARVPATEWGEMATQVSLGLAPGSHDLKILYPKVGLEFRPITALHSSQKAKGADGFLTAMNWINGLLACLPVPGMASTPVMAHSQMNAFRAELAGQRMVSGARIHFVPSSLPGTAGAMMNVGRYGASLEGQQGLAQLEKSEGYRWPATLPSQPAPSRPLQAGGPGVWLAAALAALSKLRRGGQGPKVPVSKVPVSVVPKPQQPQPPPPAVTVPAPDLGSYTVGPLPWPTRQNGLRTEVQVPEAGQIEFALGRRAGVVKLVIPYPSISSFHASITVVAGSRTVIVRDPGSKNGTSVKIGDGDWVFVPPSSSQDFIAPPAGQICVVPGHDMTRDYKRSVVPELIFNFPGHAVTPLPRPAVRAAVSAPTAISPQVPLPTGREMEQAMRAAAKGARKPLGSGHFYEGAEPAGEFVMRDMRGNSTTVHLPAELGLEAVPPLMGRLKNLGGTPSLLPDPILQPTAHLQLTVEFVTVERFESRAQLHGVASSPGRDLIYESGLILVSGGKSNGATVGAKNLRVSDAGVVGQLSQRDLAEIGQAPANVMLLIPFTPNSSPDRLLAQLQTGLQRASDAVKVPGGNRGLVDALRQMFQ